MTARALLLGCQTPPLAGIDNDLRLMHELVAARGFDDVRILKKDAATRDGIIDAFVDLAKDTDADDAVVVYYSGHGGLAVDPADRQRTAQYIVPTDYGESIPGDFRGITDEEVNLLLATVTSRTENVSVVLDCCHAAQMVRAPTFLPKALPAATYVDLAAHTSNLAERLEQQGVAGSIARNADAVRFVACGQWEVTHEFENLDQQYGRFTYFLHSVLAEVGTLPLTWGGLVPPVRRWLRLSSPHQSPVAEQHGDRLLFSTDPGDVTGVLAATRTQQGASLDGGRIVGVGVGDAYAALPVGDPDLARRIARLTVRSITAVTALADVTLERGAVELPRLADARPITRTAPRPPVMIAADVALDPVRAAASASRYIRPVAEDPGEPVLARVDADPAGAVVSDPVGPVTAPIPLGSVLGNLERMARATALREVDPGDSVIGADFAVTWGAVAHGVFAERSATGETLFVGDPIALRLTNSGPRTLYAFVFVIDGGFAVTLITGNNPSGVPLVSGQVREVPRRDPQAPLTGLAMEWPADVATERPRPESLLVIATTQPTDLRMLAQDGVVGPPRAGASTLDDVLYQIMGGGPRDVRASDASSVVHRIDYQLVAAPRPRSEHGAFLLDERCDVSLALAALADDAAPPTDCAVALAALTVGPDHPLYGPDLRVDVLVVTLAADGTPTATAATIRPGAPPAGADVVAPPQQVFGGQARGVLDVAMWLGRDPGGAPALADLLPAVPAPGGAGAMGRAAARIDVTAALFDAAGDALSAHAEVVTGLYRATYPGPLGFGLGEHPDGPLGTEQHVAVALRVEA